MPVIKIDMWEGKDKDTKKKLIESVSKAVSQSLNISEEWVHIVINEIPKENWGINGKQATEIY
ncbi:2-hydroxymuconate tautomerase family protein [bacterium]|nr:2-hydroxymuconate tautomerase family protein [bacterium]